MSQPIGLCADDFALHPAIDEAVFILAARKIIHSTSVMTTSPHWLQSSAKLKHWIIEHPNHGFKIGLHFNLTEGFGNHSLSLNQWLYKTYFHRVSAFILRDHWRNQMDRFIKYMGYLPDYIDGHQHVHQFPIIQQALFDILREYDPDQLIGVRNTRPATSGLGFKAEMLGFLGGRSLETKLKRAGRPTNDGFAGVYDFQDKTPEMYGHRLKKWQRCVGENGLIMCHPAAGRVPGDPISMARQLEFAWLNRQSAPM